MGDGYTRDPYRPEAKTQSQSRCENCAELKAKYLEHEQLYRDLKQENAWLKRLEFEAQRQRRDNGRFEVRHAQLVEILRLGRERPGLLSFEERSKAQLMVSQLGRWLRAYASARENPNACRPRFRLTEIDQFAFGLSERLLKFGVLPPHTSG